MSTLREQMKLSLKQAERNARKPIIDSEPLGNGNTILEGILHDLWLKVVEPVLSALNISVSVFNDLLDAFQFLTSASTRTWTNQLCSYLISFGVPLAH
jgi:hypothetical protein